MKIKIKNDFQKTNVEDDPWCDPDNPKMISYKDTVKATSVIKEYIAKTPLNVFISFVSINPNTHCSVIYVYSIILFFFRDLNAAFSLIWNCITNSKPFIVREGHNFFYHYFKNIVTYLH